MQRHLNNYNFFLLNFITIFHSKKKTIKQLNRKESYKQLRRTYYLSKTDIILQNLSTVFFAFLALVKGLLSPNSTILLISMQEKQERQHSKPLISNCTNSL